MSNQTPKQKADLVARWALWSVELGWFICKPKYLTPFGLIAGMARWAQLQSQFERLASRFEPLLVTVVMS